MPSACLKPSILLIRLELKAEASRLRYKNTAQIAAIDDAIALQPEDLIKRQLQSAIKTGDIFRTRAKEIELKDIALDHISPEALSLSKCTLLRTPASYADGVWLNSRAEETRATMHKWQDGPLIQSLTKLSAADASKAKVIFRDIQALMGDYKIRKGHSEADILLRLMTVASENFELRPESKWAY